MSDADELISRAIAEGLVTDQGGYPQIAESAIDWVDEHIAEADAGNAWGDLGRHWLEMLNETLGGSFELVEEGRVVLLSALPERPRGHILGLATHALAGIEAALPSLAPEPQGSSRCFVHLEDVDSYYSYIAPWYPEQGEFAASGGMFLGGALSPHVVLFGNDEWWGLSRAIPHELAHFHLYGRAVPMWLDEGVAMLMESVAGRIPRVELDREMLDRLWTAWGEHGLDRFWSGESFYDPELSDPSYELARILVYRVAGDFRDRFAAFVGQADAADAGQAAAHEHLGLTLGGLAGDLLGAGEWEPKTV